MKLTGMVALHRQCPMDSTHVGWCREQHIHQCQTCGNANAHACRAAELGVTHLDTSDIYGFYESETLTGTALLYHLQGLGNHAQPHLQGSPQTHACAGKAIVGNREAYTIATKFGAWSGKGPDGAVIQGVNGDPAYVRKAVEGSLQRLGVDSIDLYYQHR